MLATTASLQSPRKAIQIAGLVVAVCTAANIALPSCYSADSTLPGPSTLDQFPAADDASTTVRANGCSGSCDCRAVNRVGCHHRGTSCRCSKNCSAGCDGCKGKCQRIVAGRGNGMTYRPGNTGGSTCSCRFRLPGAGGRLRRFVCRVGSGGGIVRNAPDCNMPGHSPYETWRVYYYYRPYQSMHVDEQLGGVAAAQHNSYSNEQFCNIHGTHAEQVAAAHPITPELPNNRRYLEFGSCHEPLSTSSPADYQRPAVHLPEPAVSATRMDIRPTRDSRVRERTQDHEVEEVHEVMPAPLSPNELSTLARPRQPSGELRSSRHFVQQADFDIVDPATLRRR